MFQWLLVFQVLWLQTKPRSSSLYHQAWYEVSICYICFFVKHVQLDLIRPMNIVPECLWFVQLQFCKTNSCCQILFGEKGLLPSPLSCHTWSVFFLLIVSNINIYCAYKGLHVTYCFWAFICLSMFYMFVFRRFLISKQSFSV